MRKLENKVLLIIVGGMLLFTGNITIAANRRVNNKVTTANDIKIFYEGRVEAARNNKALTVNHKTPITSAETDIGCSEVAKAAVVARENNVVNKQETVLKQDNDSIKDSAGTMSYLPYIQVGGEHFLRAVESSALSVDLFVPLWQQELSDLVFADWRIYHKNDSSFEGNLHLGYRHLFADSHQLVGVYGAFDRRKTGTSNYFNQLVVGGEYWINRLFIGMNMYKPIGNTKKKINGSITKLIESNGANSAYRNIRVMQDVASEQAMAGIDIETGYELLEGLIGYVGGYYFNADQGKAFIGPRARLTYDWLLDDKQGLLAVVDKLGVEARVSNDKQRGTVWCLSANLRLGLIPNQKRPLSGVARHMVDQVRRDPDIVVGSVNEQIVSRSLQLKTVDDLADFYVSLQEPDLDIIAVNFDLKNIDSDKIKQSSCVKKPWIFIDNKAQYTHIGELLHITNLAPTIALDLNNNGSITQNANETLSAYDYTVINSKAFVSNAGEFWHEQMYGKKCRKVWMTGHDGKLIEVCAYTPEGWQKHKDIMDKASHLEP